MTQVQYNVIGMKPVGEYSVPIFSSMPEELKGCWIHVTKLDNLAQVKYVICVYFNNTHPENTIVISDFLPTEYPDLYATVNKNLMNERVYIQPKYRKKGLLPAFGLIGRTIFYEYLDALCDVPLDRSMQTESATCKAKAMCNEEIKEVPVEQRSAISLFDINPPRDPVYPNIWHGHRAGGKND
jgi:hypothetical protein